MTARTFSTLKTLFQGRDPQDWVDDLMDSIKGGGFLPIPLTALREIVSNNVWRPVGSGNEIGTIQVPLTALSEVVSNNIWRHVGSGNEIGTIQVPLTALSEVVSNNIWRPVGSGNVIGTIQVPLTAVREVASNNIPNAAGIGGILASDSTPILQFTNGDTDSALRLNYAATVVDPITFQVVLPDDLDEGQDIVISFRAAMAAANDTPTITAETFFNEGDTKVSDASAAVTGATVADYAITIAAADVPSGARTMSVELTPGAHGTDALYVYGIWVEYSVLATPALGFTNGDTDSALRLSYAAAVVDPVTFQVVLPDDLDEGQNLVINVRAAMSSTNDTPTITAETFFNEGDTKVSDASAAVTGATVADYAITIAAADVPSGARTMSVELTPGAHGTDILYVYGIWVEYSVLATPALGFTNGDTDSALRLSYAAAVVDPVTFQVVLPDDLDEGQNLVINIRAAMSSTNDTPTITAETFFNEGDTKVSDASAAVTGATVADYAITIAAADVPSGARTMSVELTPGAHGTDALYVYGIWVEYSVLATPALGYINGDTDSALRLTWAAGNTDKVAVQVPLPPDLDADAALELHLRAAMAATNDTPTIAVESFFNEGDTKVSDASAAVTGATYAEYTVTIAAADVPTGAQTVSLELTPGAHATDALHVTAMWLEYTRA